MALWENRRLIDFQNLARAFVEPGKFSLEVLPAYYRALFPDLEHLRDAQLIEHFRRYGRAEGRSASPCDLRSAFVACLSPAMKVLEIGPFTAPTLRGPNVSYFDVLDADGLRARAVANNYPIVEPVRVDYVSANGNLSIVPSGFEAVFSAHCIEHTPDLIGHLEQVSRILLKGGVYLMTVPDMRYTFDHYRSETRAIEIVTAHREGRQLHARQAVIDFYTLSTHNDPAAHWRGEHGPYPRHDIIEREKLAEHQLACSESGYVDIHTWFFAANSFGTVMGDVLTQTRSDFEIERVYTPPFDKNEFNAVLRKT